jgi:hypothetical protein
VIRTRAGGPHRIDSTGTGDAGVGRAIDPVTGGGDSCVVTRRSESPGTARIELFEAAKRPITMIGSPRLRAKITVSGADPSVTQIAARLWDVAPNGTDQRLVARGFYRPRAGRNTWQLHPGSWRFDRGHTAELELLGADPPFGRPSNAAFQTEIDDLRIRTPVR